MLLQPAEEELSRLLVVVGMGKYLIEDMLGSETVLDLRYYRGSQEIAPFRYCHPLRA